MVIPSLLLGRSGGCTTSVWVWESAAGSRSAQAQYSSQRLAADVDSLGDLPGGLGPAARGPADAAPSSARTPPGNTGGAWLSTMAQT